MVLARCGTVFPVSVVVVGGCAGGGVLLGVVIALSWCGVSLGSILIIEVPEIQGV